MSSESVKRGFSLAAVLVAGAVIVTSEAAPAQPATAAPCTPSGGVVRVPELTEGSGIAASRRTPGRFWAHNDSGEPVLFALDDRGDVTGRVVVSGAEVEDWEAVAVGPCPSGSCIHVGDIGDNNATRKQVTVYRFAEPAEAGSSVKATDIFNARYPDGAHDAEALLITSNGRLHIVTKGENGPVALYRFPAELRPGPTMRLERVGGPSDSVLPAASARITDGSVSADGAWIVLRTTRALSFFRTAELLAGNWREAARVDLASLGEPQGEGVTFAGDNSIYLVGEGGGGKRPGTFARLTCTLSR